MSDKVTVGDLDSNAIGTGARKSDGKPPLELIPVSHWLVLWRGDLQAEFIDCMESLAAWQEGDDQAIWDALLAMHRHWGESIKAFDYGRRKYAAWNWAKGMPWGVPLGCILRHMQKIGRGQRIDEESGASHAGCIVCNLHMLAWYLDHYRDGDDRPIFERIPTLTDRYSSELER